MKKPEMIIFDYGQTLACEPGFDLRHGYRAILEYVKENPNHITGDELYEASEGLFKEFEQCRKLGFEVHQQRALCCAFERHGISFSVEINMLEQVLWDNTSLV